MTRNFSRLILVSVLLAAFSAPRNTPAPDLTWMNKVDPWVLETAANGQTEFILYLREQADLSHAAQFSAKIEKGKYVYSQLAGLALRTQGPILSMLEKSGLQHRSYWIENMIWVRGDLSAVQAMAQLPDVAHIYANPRIKMDLPDPSRSLIPPEPQSPDTIRWNISIVRAPDVWAMGYTGQGAVVGGADTGYQWDHPALIDQYRGWDGFNANHNYNWHDAIDTVGDPWHDSPTPVDPYGHGTHTMGTMVGDDGADHQIGVAPGAKWIGCRNMDYHGYGTPATYIECYEWFIAPYPIGGNPLTQGDASKAPDVINNSWACIDSEGCPDGSILLLDAVQAVRAAGILTVHSAGNSGPACGTIRDPAAIYPESFTVGATNSSDRMYEASSRGPATVNYQDHSETVLKPNVSAPGVSVYSSIPTNTYGYATGTSMAAPHVAGLVALMISAHPNLAGNVDEIEDLIEGSAVALTPSNQECGGISDRQVPNNTFGWGRIDALTAVADSSFSLEKTISTGLIIPWQPFTYTLQVSNYLPLTPVTNVVVSDVMPANTIFITATLPHTRTGDLLEWAIPSLGGGESASFDLVLQASPTVTESLTNRYYGVRGDGVPSLQGPPLQTLVAKYFLYFPYMVQGTIP